MVIIRELLVLAASMPGCRVLPSKGMPSVDSSRLIPDDLQAFYGSCGGVELFTEALYSSVISSPNDLVPANPVIVGESFPDDITDSWYIISRGEEEFISIDLCPDRSGICYDSFPDVRGVAGSCAIVATSFSDLFERLLEGRGERWYWLNPDFVSLGDAYDR